MKLPLEVRLIYGVEAEMPKELASVEAAAKLRTKPDIRPFPLMLGTFECPTDVLFQAVTIQPASEPGPDEFRCDSCRGAFSNDDKNINDIGDELCDNCRSRNG